MNNSPDLFSLLDVLQYRNCNKKVRMRSSHFQPQEQHIHYHYHYHYDQPQQNPLHSQSSHSPYSHTNKPLRTTSPRTYSSTIQNNYWKRHVNPEVSKLYDNFQTKKSRFSENPNKISQEESMLETPRMAKNMLATECQEDTTFGQRRPLSKLQSLYYQKQAVKRHIYETESITNETSDAFLNMHEQKLKMYRQLQRLRRVEEECVYLRDNFMLHVETKHRQSK